MEDELISVKDLIKMIEEHKKIADRSDAKEHTKAIYKLAHDHIIDMVSFIPRR